MPRAPRPGAWGAGGQSVAERPALAVKIAVIANLWTSIEGHMAYALGAMIGSDDKVAMAILSKVQTATAKSQMIRAVGKASLDKRLEPELLKLLKSFDDLAPRRNHVVHGLWGTTDAEPDGLLWVPPTAPNKISLGLMNAMMSGDPMGFIRDALASAELWEAEDFDALIADLSGLASESVTFATRMMVLSTAKSQGMNVEAILSKGRED